MVHCSSKYDVYDRNSSFVLVVNINTVLALLSGLTKTWFSVSHTFSAFFYSMTLLSLTPQLVRWLPLI